jgi:phosphoinositide-3-kinase regulatory subunit 4
VTPSNASVFIEYVLPNVRHFATDPDTYVRCVYAQCLAPLADVGVRFLEMTQAMKADGTFKLSDANNGYDKSPYKASYDVTMGELVDAIQEQVVTLLTDTSAVVKRALLTDITALCIFFGRVKTNDVLLSHTITYLNDRDWLLRAVFFEAAVGVATCIGGRNVEEYILPLMMQALSGKSSFLMFFSDALTLADDKNVWDELTDDEDFVVARVITSLTTLAELGLFGKANLWELLANIIPFLCHPDIWIRHGNVVPPPPGQSVLTEFLHSQRLGELQAQSTLSHLVLGFCPPQT